MYKFKNWKNKTGTIPVSWTADDYTTKTEWYAHHGGAGFKVYQQSQLEVYKDNIGVLIPEQLLPVFDEVKKYFDLKDLVCDLSKYTPGMILPWHSDTFPTYSKNMGITNLDDIVRIIIFLHQDEPGHQLWIEDKLCRGNAGTWFAWTGNQKHMAANIGESDRYVIQLTGHI